MTHEIKMEFKSLETFLSELEGVIPDSTKYGELNDSLTSIWNAIEGYDEAIQNLQETIDEKNEEINTLESENASLAKQLESI